MYIQLSRDSELQAGCDVPASTRLLMPVLLLQSEVSEFEDQLEQVEGFNLYLLKLILDTSGWTARLCIGFRCLYEGLDLTGSVLSSFLGS
jgi:hypothetical protein